jgi:hypothetical protein
VTLMDTSRRLPVFAVVNESAAMAKYTATVRIKCPPLKLAEWPLRRFDSA